MLLLFFSRGRIQKQRAVAPDLFEVEHLSDRVGDPIERAAAQALSTQPVVLDEVDDGTLIAHAVVDEVLLGPGGNDQQREPRAVTSAAQSMGIRDDADAGQGSCSCSAESGAGQGVRRSG